MALTNPTPNRPSATLGNLPEGMEHISQPLGRVLARIEAGLCIEPASFWFVWTKKGRVPRFAHDSLEAAQAEAARLARLNPGQKFIVLQAVEKIAAPPTAEASADAA